jgi:ABC-type antimicrobial peptide transport system permease subunit
MRDLRFAVRLLRQAPIFTITAVVTVVATLVPAIRIVRLNPIKALRSS